MVSRDDSAGDDGFEAITACYVMGTGLTAEVLGLQLKADNVIDKVAGSSPFAAKCAAPGRQRAAGARPPLLPFFPRCAGSSLATRSSPSTGTGW